jgi:hypothetical protein
LKEQTSYFLEHGQTTGKSASQVFTAVHWRQQSIRWRRILPRLDYLYGSMNQKKVACHARIQFKLVSGYLSTGVMAGGFSSFFNMQFKEGLKPTTYIQWEEKIPEEVCRGFDDDHVHWSGDSGWNALSGEEKASILVGTVRLCLTIKV